MTFRSDLRRARTAFWWVGVIVPLTMLVLSTTVVLAWWPDLPDPVAIHWSGSAPDGFAPKPLVLLPNLIGAGLVVLFAALALFAHRLPREMLSGSGGVISDTDGTPQWSLTARFLGATSLGLAAMMGFLTVVSALLQRGLADAKDAGDIGPWAFAGFGLLVGLAVVGWFLQPRVAPTPVTPAAVAPAVAGDAWSGTVTMARSGLIVLGVAMLVLVAATVFTIAAGDAAAASWILVAVTVGMLLIIASSIVFRVRIDAGGLRVRSLLGWPSTRIRLDEIAQVGTVQVDPFAEFGGWGWRLGLDGRSGVVMRKGGALQITRTNGRVFVVTVDAAAEAAGILEGLRTRRPH